MTDNPGKRRFVKIAKDMDIERGSVYETNFRLSCIKHMVIKIETKEGFHTKTMNCDHIEALTEVSETFVPRMSNIVTEVGTITDYNLLATEMAQPMSEEFIEEEELKEDYLMFMDITEAVSTGVSKVGFDEEIIWQLKQRNETD